MPTTLDFYYDSKLYSNLSVNNNFHTAEIAIKVDNDNEAPKEILEYLRTAYFHRKKELVLIRFWKISSI